MAIKSTLTSEKQESPEWKFPCLGKSTQGTLVLFSGHREGVQLSGCYIGTWDKEWIMSQFTPLDPSEVVQLQNEE